MVPTKTRQKQDKNKTNTLVSEVGTDLYSVCDLTIFVGLKILKKTLPKWEVRSHHTVPYSTYTQ
jgi:hypothetical protein